MKSPTLGLALIVKDETKELETLFASIQGVFDEIVVAWNGADPATRTICERHGARVVPYVWQDHFAHARNFSFGELGTDLCMWLDADDTLVNAGELRATVANAFSDPEVNIVEMPYHYDHDEYGNCTMKLWNGRIVRKGTFKWVGAIHECLLPIQDFKKCRVENVWVRHNVDPERVSRSAERNLRICQKEYEREHKDGSIDPRTTLYYAKSLNGMGRFKEAVEVFEEYLEQSEWDDEKYEVLCTLADFHTRSRQYFKAQDYARRALTIRPQYGQAYFELAEIFYRLERWDDCVHLIRMGLASKCPLDIIPVDPSEYRLRPLILLEFALFQLGQAQESLNVINEALKLQPKNEHLLARRKAVLGFIARIELERSAVSLLKWLTHTGETQKLPALLGALPEVVRDHPDFVRLRNGLEQASGARNKIVIYCGPTFETWNPDTAKTSGLGGSEEAVVYLAQELVRLGWIVEVFNNCDKPGVYAGVEYRNFWEHDPAVTADIFIAWRNSEYVLRANAGARVFVWLHDRQRPEYWTSERVSRMDKAIVLSKYHRQDLADLPESKIFYSRNGIVPAQFAGTAAIQRDHQKCVYASSPDRGLDVLLELWPEIRKKAPDAHLHVFYGFSKTYDMLHKDHENMMQFKERILKALQQDGVHYHGKVPHHELHEHLMSAGLWLYPTHFTEISCITAMKAQAAGAVPITMTLAALDETVRHGYKIAFGIQDTRARQAFVNIAVDLLTHPEKQDKVRAKMMPWALEHYAWKEVASEWDRCFKAHLGDRAADTVASSSSGAGA